MAGGIRKWSRAAAKGGIIGVARQTQSDRRALPDPDGLSAPDPVDQSPDPDDQAGLGAADELDDDDGGGELQPDLKNLAKDQMGRVERVGAGSSLRSIARLLAEDETVDLVFGCQIDGKQAVLALTDRRLLAAYGMLGRSDTIDYQSIGQVNTGLTKVEIKGAGVSLTAKAVARKDELVRALSQRRQTSPSAETAHPASSRGDDPVALLEQLGRLREQGVLTEEEFVAKKAELLGRM